MKHFINKTFPFYVWSFIYFFAFFLAFLSFLSDLDFLWRKILTDVQKSNFPNNKYLNLQTHLFVLFFYSWFVGVVFCVFLFFSCCLFLFFVLRKSKVHDTNIQFTKRRFSVLLIPFFTTMKSTNSQILVRSTFHWKLVVSCGTLWTNGVRRNRMRSRVGVNVLNSKTINSKLQKSYVQNSWVFELKLEF